MKRSDISDLEVCCAVAEYKKALEENPPLLFIPGQDYPPFPYESLAKKYGCDEKLAYSACERACSHGLIEYGVSLRTGWLTEKGKQLLSSS